MINLHLACEKCGKSYGEHWVDTGPPPEMVCPKDMDADVIREKALKVLKDMSRKERRAWCRKHGLPYAAVADKPTPPKPRPGPAELIREMHKKLLADAKKDPPTVFFYKGVEIRNAPELNILERMAEIDREMN